MKKTKAYLYFPVSADDLTRLGITESVGQNSDANEFGIYLTSYDVGIGLDRWEKDGAKPTADIDVNIQSSLLGSVSLDDTPSHDEFGKIIEINVTLTQQLKEKDEKILQLNAQVKLKETFANSYKMELSKATAVRDKYKQVVQNIPQRKLNALQQLIVKVFKI